MVQRNILIDGKELKYEGIMDARKLCAVIYHWFKERHYNLVEKLNFEQTFEEGKQMEVRLMPFKRYDDYTKSEIKVAMNFTQLKEVEVDLNGVKRKLWKGKVSIKFTATLITDAHNRWNEKPFLFFFRVLMDKFFLKNQISRAEGECQSDCESLIDEVKSFLNLYRWT